jgi:ribosomal protein L7/L12
MNLSDLIERLVLATQALPANHKARAIVICLAADVADAATSLTDQVTAITNQLTEEKVRVSGLQAELANLKSAAGQAALDSAARQEARKITIRARVTDAAHDQFVSCTAHPVALIKALRTATGGGLGDNKAVAEALLGHPPALSRVPPRPPGTGPVVEIRVYPELCQPLAEWLEWERV